MHRNGKKLLKNYYLRIVQPHYGSFNLSTSAKQASAALGSDLRSSHIRSTCDDGRAEVEEVEVVVEEEEEEKEA
jgi:hypothetical protein